MECPRCAASNPEGKRFCGDCGTPLLRPFHSNQPVGDDSVNAESRRLVTVVFCDLVNFTELSRRTDPEDLAELLSGFQRICAREAKRNDGHIAQFLGDGVLIYFGFPRAHENDAHRALDCGLAILDALHAAPASHPNQRLDARIGAHTGRVFISALRAGDHREVLALGEVPNVAARITAEAEPGCFWVGEATWRLAEGWFDGVSQGPHRVRGIDEELNLWRIIGRTEATSRLEAASQQAPFVGRQQECAQLRAIWTELVAESRPRLVTIIGGPGLGKSRLVEQLLSGSWEPIAPKVLRMRCLETTSATAFHPIKDMLMQQFSAPELGVGPEASINGEVLRDRCAALGLNDPLAVPLLAELMGIELSPAEYPSPTMSPARRHARTIDVLANATGALAQHENPLLLVVEDLQWADASTLTWLQSLMESQSEAPLLVLGTSRPEFGPGWQGAAFAFSLLLDRLSPTDSAELIRGIANSKSLPLQLMHSLIARCEGVPLYLEEATRALLLSGALLEGEFLWEVHGAATPFEIPSSLESALAARIDQLGEARDTLYLAAAIGREVPVPLLEAVCSQEPTVVRSHIEAMRRTSLIEPLDTRTYPHRLRFKHALIRDAAYEAISRRARPALHARVADTLRSRFPRWADQLPELFAWHLAGAGDRRNAVRYLHLAADRAASKGGLDEAIVHLEQAVQLLRELPPDPETLQAELPLLLMIGGLYNARAWSDSTLFEIADRITEICSQVPSPEAEQFANWGRWSVWWARGRIPESLDVAAEMLQACARDDCPPFLPLAARYAHLLPMFEGGNLEAVLEDSQQDVGKDARAIDGLIAANYQVSPLAGVLITHACGYYLAGRYSEEAAEWQRIAAYVDQLAPQPIAQLFATSFTLSLRLISGSLPDWEVRDPHGLDRDIDRLLRACQEEGLGMWQAFATLFQAALETHRGNHVGLRHRVAEQIRLLDASGVRLFFVHFLTLYGWLCHIDGDTEAALSLLEDAEAEANRSAQRLGLWDTYRRRALVLAEAGRSTEALESLARAIEASMRMGSPTAALRCTLDQHEILARYGREAEGLDLLAKAVARMPESDFETADLGRAHRLLSDTTGQHRGVQS